MQPNNLAFGLHPTVASGDEWRWFAGQPDPADPSHFTLGYEVNEVPGTIDGWLCDDETVLLRPRTGPVEWQQRHGLWFAVWHQRGAIER